MQLARGRRAGDGCGGDQRDIEGPPPPGGAFPKASLQEDDQSPVFFIVGAVSFHHQPRTPFPRSQEGLPRCRGFTRALCHSSPAHDSGAISTPSTRVGLCHPTTEVKQCPGGRFGAVLSHPGGVRDKVSGTGTGCCCPWALLGGPFGVRQPNCNPGSHNDPDMITALAFKLS